MKDFYKVLEEAYKKIDKEVDKEFDEAFSYEVLAGKPELEAIVEEFKQDFKDARKRKHYYTERLNQKFKDSHDDRLYNIRLDDIEKNFDEDIATAKKVYWQKLADYRQRHGLTDSYDDQDYQEYQDNQYNQGPGLLSSMTSWVGGYLLFRKLFR